VAPWSAALPTGGRTGLPTVRNHERSKRNHASRIDAEPAAGKAFSRHHHAYRGGGAGRPGAPRRRRGWQGWRRSHPDPGTAVLERHPNPGTVVLLERHPNPGTVVLLERHPDPGSVAVLERHPDPGSVVVLERHPDQHAGPGEC